MMQLIIEYAYTQHVPVTEDNVEQLLQAADQFCAVGIVQACCDFLEAQLCPQNCIGIWKFTDTYFCPDLRHRAFRFILHNFEEIGRTSEEFLELSLNQLCDIIERDDLNIKHEDVVFDLVLHWISHSPKERKPYISMLLPKVRMGLMSADFIMNNVKDNSVVKDSNECKPIIINAMRARCSYNTSKSAKHAQSNPLRRPRLPHTVLLAIGGWSGSNPTNAIESYDMRANCWVNVSHEESPRAYHGAVFLNGFVYCIGGRDNMEYFSSVRKFDPAALTWHEAAPMHCCRCFVSVTELDGQIYAMGGFDGYVRLNSAERYNPETNQWSFIAPMHEHRSDASATTLHGKVYICGGFNGEDCLFTAEFYMPQTNQWTMITPMSSRRSGVGVTVYGGEVFVVGGFDGVNRLRSVDAYDPLTNSWRAVPDMTTARSNFGIEVLDNRLFVVGGFNGFTTTFYAECYDERTDEWSNIHNMGFFRSALSCCVVAGLPNMSHYAAPRDTM
ncbi:kelch-like protein 10 [Megalops cyprinoides]|uniref:kelch-like protein 10 n=1 Tax=Megalops cyprinoides TaxID=118141 RepID=UPI001863A7CA|nr:kelch-like protein 10 [Megalops cyprinoides]